MNTITQQAIKNADPKSFDLTFEGYGTVNGLRYKDNGTGIYITNPVDGSVYQKGVIELKTDSDAIETTYESISRKSERKASTNYETIQYCLPSCSMCALVCSQATGR